MTSIQAALKDTINRFKTSDNLAESARIDAEVLLAYVLKTSRTSLYTHALSNLDEKTLQHYQQCVEKRLMGIPIAYIVGLREFWSLALEVNEYVLIPRPETELLIEVALNNNTLNHNANCEVLDLGTGSGAIALALASERPHWHITAVDISPNALAVARRNAQKHQIKNITWIESDWLDALPKQNIFDMIVSNPPYIAPDDAHLNQGDLRFEPQSALVAAQNGYACLFHIIHTCLARLAPNGLLLIEHGEQQYEPVKMCFENSGFQNIVQYRDLQNHIRVTAGTSRALCDR